MNGVKTKKYSHTLRPIQLNVFYLPDAFRTAEFEDKLLQFPSLARSFQESLIAGSNYTFLWSGIPRNNNLNIESFRFDAQMAGNLVSGFTRIIQGKRERGDYTIFGRPYAQYLRFEWKESMLEGLGTIQSTTGLKSPNRCWYTFRKQLNHSIY